MAGFECSDQLNVHGERVDLLVETRHLEKLEEDYQNVASMGFRTVREGIRWSKVEGSPCNYQWDDVIKVMRAARFAGIQVIWDMCHFGFPEDLTPLHPKFHLRFAALCEAFARLHQEICPGEELLVVPINEVSFMSWLGGDARGTTPYCCGQGWEVKYHLMKAFIAGVQALRRINPSAVIILSEPLIKITTEIEDSDYEAEVRAMSDNQFQVADILCGRMCPELGGKPEYLDVMGFNYYYDNQWDHDQNRVLDWRRPETEKRHTPLYRLLIDAYERYRKPFILSETSHPKEDRPLWFDMISWNVSRLLAQGYPMLGVCVYPIIDRPNWDALDDWHQSGLWDNLSPLGGSDRALYEPYAQAIQGAMERHRTAMRIDEDHSHLPMQ